MSAESPQVSASSVTFRITGVLTAIELANARKQAADAGTSQRVPRSHCGLCVFAARMILLLATAVFSLVFISKALVAQMSSFRYILTLVGLFSLFLFMQELERLGNAFHSAADKPRLAPLVSPA